MARVGPAGNNCSGTSVDSLRSAQPTDQINTHNTDQPWVAIHSYVPDPSLRKLRSNAPFPIPMQNDVYIAYDDFSRPDVPVRVAVSVGANPPNFTIDQQVGTKGSGFVNPGHRLAVAPQSIDNNGDFVGRGFVYSLHQRCADCSVVRLNSILCSIASRRSWSRVEPGRKSGGDRAFRPQSDSRHPNLVRFQCPVQ